MPQPFWNFCPLLAIIPLAVALASPAPLGGDVDLRQREAAANEAATILIKDLGAALKEEMGKGGPAIAVNICTALAPQIAGRISRTYGWRVTRVTNKARNPLLGMPDAWE